MSLAQEITLAMGGDYTGHTGTLPMPSHSPDDRGTSVRDEPGAPDGVIINTFNGGDPLQVKDILRAKGILPPRAKLRTKDVGGPHVYRDANTAPVFRVVRKRGGSVCLNRPARFLSGAAAGFMPLREAVG